jgi:hypothetical protein
MTGFDNIHGKKTDNKNAIKQFVNKRLKNAFKFDEVFKSLQPSCQVLRYLL